jgi:hypothetical protein
MTAHSAIRAAQSLWSRARVDPHQRAFRVWLTVMGVFFGYVVIVHTACPECFPQGFVSDCP